MATFNLRRFSDQDGLKTIRPDHLLALLRPHESFFGARKVNLPPDSHVDGLDYNALVSVFMTPGSDTPKELADALFLIHEMATPEGMDALVDEAAKNGVVLNRSPPSTPADLAVQLYILRRDLVERKHAELYLLRSRSFEHFQSTAKRPPKFKAPTDKVLKALEQDLDDWFESKHRGRGSRVFCFPRDEGVWFHVRHGEPYRREGSIENGESSSVFYRPAKHDNVVYDPTIGEIQINARSKGEKELYRTKFGLHLFRNEDFFPGKSKYTLEPLRRDNIASLVCTDIDGMEWVKLREIQYYFGGALHEIETHKADDVFDAYRARGRRMPARLRIFRATFQIKFADSKTPRSVVIRSSNIAQYTRDADSALVEEWLTKRGFILTEREDEHEDA
ncbi:MAG: hypothetical protein AABZ47_05375 [Planctomycetota bacterium]